MPKERLSAVYITITLSNSASVHQNWTLACFKTSWGVDLTRIFFTEKPGIIYTLAASP